MKRREFITLLGGAAAVGWPLAARAQQQTRRIGVLMAESESDPESDARVTAFNQSLAKLGWTIGRNLQIDYRWAAGDVERTRVATAELLRLAPNVILAIASPSVRSVQQAAPTIPIVFIGVSEPIAQGFVQSLSHPGGNVTGFTNLEWGFGAKWVQLLKEIAPHLSRVAIVFNPDTAPYVASFVPSVETAAQELAVEPVMAAVRQPADIDATMHMLAREQGGGLILPPDIFTTTHRKLVVELAARYGLPTIYPFRFFPVDGGLMSYGIDIPNLFRLAAGYIDRILKGERPADLPVQQPTKYEFAINLKTAKALGLEVPPTLLAAPTR